MASVAKEREQQKVEGMLTGEAGEQPKGPTSTPAGTATPTATPTPADKPKRTRTPRAPKADGLTQDDLKSFETYLTEKIKTGRKDDAVTYDQLEAWGDARKRVRGLITNAGGAQ